MMHYPWGTTDAIPALLGLPADGQPYAEYWLGAHPLGPASVGGEPLPGLISANPSVLGAATRARFGDGLPFLMKILSARHALSIQAHPSREQAEEGYAREQLAGVAMDAPERTYKDAWPKPEILIALDEFHTLFGFREPQATARLFVALGVAGQLSSVIGPLTARKGPAALADSEVAAMPSEAIFPARLAARVRDGAWTYCKHRFLICLSCSISAICGLRSRSSEASLRHQSSRLRSKLLKSSSAAPDRLPNFGTGRLLSESRSIMFSTASC